MPPSSELSTVLLKKIPTVSPSLPSFPPSHASSFSRTCELSILLWAAGERCEVQDVCEVSLRLRVNRRLLLRGGAGIAAPAGRKNSAGKKKSGEKKKINVTGSLFYPPLLFPLHFLQSFFMSCAFNILIMYWSLAQMQMLSLMMWQHGNYQPWTNQDLNSCCIRMSS